MLNRRVTYKRRCAWRTKSNKFRTVKTPGRSSKLNVQVANWLFVTSRKRPEDTSVVMTERTSNFKAFPKRDHLSSTDFLAVKEPSQEPMVALRLTRQSESGKSLTLYL